MKENFGWTVFAIIISALVFLLSKVNIWLGVLFLFMALPFYTVYFGVLFDVGDKNE